MRSKKLFSIISYGLCLMLLLTGCEKDVMTPPELLKPVSVNESYRPVEKGSIGDLIIRDGVVVPKDYCHFYLTSVKISEIKVNVGDYVEAGTVVALADTKGAGETIASIDNKKSLNTKQWDINCKIYEQNKKELEYRLKGANELGDTAQVATITTLLAVLAENHSYDQLFYNHSQSALDKEIVKYQEIEGNGTLVAKHSGYVTYIKDMADTDLVNGYENVVIISDYEDAYIKLPDTMKSEKLEKNNQYIYTVKNGEKVLLSEYEYLPEELMTAQGRGIDPQLRMKFATNEAMPEVGSNVPVFFQRELIDEVLIVGNDSLYQDDQGDFVYVKTDVGRELRYVELGASDTLYTEVVSGLTEGDMVYYSSDSILPEGYEEYTVSYDDYLVTGKSDFYTIKDTARRKYYSEQEGQIESVAATQGEEISSGDLVCVIRTNEGSATLTQMYNQIINFKASHVTNLEAINKAISEKETEIEAAYIARQEASQKEDTPTIAEPPNGNVPVATSTDGVPTATPGDAEKQEEPVSPYLYEELCCQLEVLKLNKELQELNYVYQLSDMESAYSKASCNNDGTGAINIYAQASGKLANTNIKAGKTVEIGDRLFNIEIPSKSVVEMRSEKTLYVNQQIEFVKGDSSYKGTVIGISGNDGSVYFTDINNRVYISSNSGKQNVSYFVKMENESFYDLKNDYVAKYPITLVTDTVVLPKDMVYYEEKVKAGVGTVQYRYVWKLVEGELVKQYVQCMGTGDTICITSGVKEGDVLARELSERTEE